MGISRLWSFIKQHKDLLVTEINLVEEAKKRHPRRLKILVDFYSWEHTMTDHFLKAATKHTHNENIIFYGGEYRMMDEFIRNFIQRMRSVNIEFVFFLDGAKSCGLESSHQKMKTWKKNHYECMTILKKIMDYLAGKDALRNFEKKIRPCLLELQNIWTLQQCGCNIQVQVSGEADCVIAKYLLDDADSFAALSNDTDFCIFPHCAYIPMELFDLEKELGLGQQFLTVGQPKKLMCGVIQAENVMKLLNLPNYEALIEFAVIAGNDFTTPFLLDVPVFKQHFWGRMNKLADLIRHKKVAEQCELFGSLIKKNPELRDAVIYSRHFYSLTLEYEEKDRDRDHIFNMIASGIHMGRLPGTIMSIRHGFYWHRMVLENPSSGLPSADQALAPLRSHLYNILLPTNITHVQECGWTRDSYLEESSVVKSGDLRVPSLDKIQMNSFEENLRIFELIIQHQEDVRTIEVRNYFQFGLRHGFLCYLLRYFLLQNWGQNLFLSKLEFYVVVAWILFQPNPSNFCHKMKIVPSPRCVTVENWFLMLYRCVYAFIGNVLGLSQEFPPPCELFSGAVWVVMYTACAVFDPDFRNREPPPRSVSREDLMSVYNIVRQVVADNKHFVEDIVQGLFQVDLVQGLFQVDQVKGVRSV